MNHFNVALKAFSTVYLLSFKSPSLIQSTSGYGLRRARKASFLSPCGRKRSRQRKTWMCAGATEDLRAVRSNWVKEGLRAAR